MKGAVRDYKRDEEILWLRNNKGWTFIKIARRYDITKGRVRTLYTRIAKERNLEELNRRMGIGA